jgi:transcriptional regulator with XRE-family HTH domain
VSEVDMDERKVLADVGRRIREHRLRARLTQAEVAERACLSNEFVSKIERGVTAPSVVTLCRIAVSLNVPLLALFGDDKALRPDGDIPCGPVIRNFLRTTGKAGEDFLIEVVRRASRLVGAASAGRGRGA